MSSIIVRLLSIAAAFLLSLLLVGIFFPVHGCNPWWAVERSYLYRLKTDVQWASIGDSQLCVDDVNAWLSDNASAELARRLDVKPKKDPWGRPYRCVAIGDAEGADRFGIYSTGRDGMSESGGNDADDINSWSERTTRYYERELMVRGLLILLIPSAFLTPFVYTFAGIVASCTVAVFRRETVDFEGAPS